MSEPNWAGAPVIPVVVIDDPAQGPPLARALLAGGVGIVEVTLRTDGALGAIARIRSEVPEIWVGAGTIRGNDDIDRALQAGAQFLVSPGTTAALRAGLIAAEVPSLPGVATIGEAMTALDEGFPVVKIFPISALGGRDLVRALAAVLPELGVCPTGGLDPRSAADLLTEPTVRCVGGSWLAPRADVVAGRWTAITARAAESLLLRKKISDSEHAKVSR